MVLHDLANAVIRDRHVLCIGKGRRVLQNRGAERRFCAAQDLCVVLAELHDRAPIHSWAASKAEIEKAFGKPVEELFESIDHKALASGSIAQVCFPVIMCMRAGFS